MKRKPIKMLAVLAAFALPVILPSAAQAFETAFEEDSSLPIVYVNLAIKAGSVTDPAGQSGITNFMGEMLLRGTRSKTKEQIDLALDQMGARLEVETRAEALIVRGAVLSSQLEPFLALMREIASEPSFPESEIRKLKAEIVSGILEELGNDSSLEGRRFSRFLFEGHPYGKPVLGTVKDVTKLTRAKIASQYERLIHDQNFVVVGEGDAHEDTMRAWASELARLRPTGSQAVIAQVSAPVNAPMRRLQIVDKPERTQTQMDVGQIGVRMTDRDYFPLYLGNYAFGGGTFSARLMLEIRVKRGWSYGAYSSFRQGLKPRSWQAHLFPAAKDAPAALAETVHLIEELHEKGITHEEFDFAQRSLVSSSGFMYNTPKKRVENTVLERTLDLPKGFMQSYAKELSLVTLEQVNGAMKNFLQPDRLAISVLGTAAELRDALTKAAGVQAKDVLVVPYTEE